MSCVPGVTALIPSIMDRTLLFLFPCAVVVDTSPPVRTKPSAALQSGRRPRVAHGFYEYTPWLGVARIQHSSKSSLMRRCSSCFFCSLLRSRSSRLLAGASEAVMFPEGEPDLVWLPPDHRCQE